MSDSPIPFGEDVAWKAWSPLTVNDLLVDLRSADGMPLRWAVAGGWAIDLFLGRVTREHEDIEIVVLRDDAPAVLAAFREPDWRWMVPTDGWLHPVDSHAFDETHQTWLWSRDEEAFVLDVFRDLHEGDRWICRRAPGISRPWSAMALRSREGVPYLAPEIVLLFKAKAAREKDAADLEQSLPSLPSDRRKWLARAIAAAHPRHPWLALV